MRPLSARDAPLSQAAALLHVSNTEQWLRQRIGSGAPERDASTRTPGRDAGRTVS